MRVRGKRALRIARARKPRARLGLYPQFDIVLVVRWRRRLESQEVCERRHNVEVGQRQPHLAGVLLALAGFRHGASRVCVDVFVVELTGSSAAVPLSHLPWHRCQEDKT
eukprot:6159599-Prymnesium_polylepis.1